MTRVMSPDECEKWLDTPLLGASDSPSSSRPDAPGAARRALGMTLYPRLFVPKLSADQRDVFNILNPTALWIGGNLDGAQPRRFGDNRGAWPVLMGMTQSWRDDWTARIKRDPCFERAVMLRYWCNADTGTEMSWRAAETLWLKVQQRLEPSCDAGLNDYLAFDPETTLAQIDSAVRDVAGREAIAVQTDRELVKHIDWLVALGRDG